mgnify:CR=1 FL=1
MTMTQASSPNPSMDLLEPPRRPWWRRPGTWVLLALGLAVLVGLALVWLRPAPPAMQFVTEPLRVGDLRITVSATGTLQPTRSVSIGSELSGTVTQVMVDVNDRVKKGDLLIRLDTSKLEAQVVRSRASLGQSKASLLQAQATLKEARAAQARNEELARLSGGKLPSKGDLDTVRATTERAEAALALAQAAVVDAQAALSSDETNLSKASVRSPIDGVVLTRSVEPGQAVAASLQAVTLMTIAADLRQMRLQVNVDEADVGRVQAQQGASFTVSAYPSRSYQAKVTRVAYGSTTTDNVVTYTTYLDVSNEDLSLRPGMTASASIAALERRQVLLVPNTALRFSPAASGAPAGAGQGGGILSQLMPRPPGGPSGASRGGNAGKGNVAAGQRQIWVLEPGQPGQPAQPRALQVQVLNSDGRYSEVQGQGLREGLSVITDQQSAKGRS